MPRCLQLERLNLRYVPYFLKLLKLKKVRDRDTPPPPYAYTGESFLELKSEHHDELFRANEIVTFEVNVNLFICSLQEVSITVEGRHACGDSSDGLAPVYEFCAGGMVRGIPQDACAGDSGGPAECVNANGNLSAIYSNIT